MYIYNSEEIQTGLLFILERSDVPKLTSEESILFFLDIPMTTESSTTSDQQADHVTTFDTHNQHMVFDLTPFKAFKDVSLFSE